MATNSGGSGPCLTSPRGTSVWRTSVKKLVIFTYPRKEYTRRGAHSPDVEGSFSTLRIHFSIVGPRVSDQGSWRLRRVSNSHQIRSFAGRQGNQCSVRHYPVIVLSWSHLGFTWPYADGTHLALQIEARVRTMAHEVPVKIVAHATQAGMSG